MARFDEIFIGRENRKSDYRTWSERAVVVGHNAENNSYNVVITTEKTLGNNVRTVNRVIRNVKSVLRPSVKTFFPGESIIVGYVDDRREHPIIVGEGDSAGHTCIKVTLGITTNIPVIEGPGAPSLVDPVLTPTPCPSNSFLQDSLTGSTTTLTVDCQSLDIFGCIKAEIDAPGGCGCGDYQWSGSGGLAGLTISRNDQLASAIGLTTTLASFGPGNRTLKICPPINEGGFIGNEAFSRAQCSTGPGHVSGTSHIGLAVRARYFCSGVFDACSSGPASVGSRNKQEVFNVAGGGAGVCTPHIGHIVAGGNADCVPRTIDCGFLVGVGAVIASCDVAQQFGIINDERTQAMKDAGCSPCEFMVDDLIITAEDACGVQRTIVIEVE